MAAAGGHAQGRYLTKTGHIDFFSGSPIEDIEANNNRVAAVLDLATGQLAFSAPIREFQFKRTLMQEHFNENYLESENIPKPRSRATLRGPMRRRWAAPARIRCR